MMRLALTCLLMLTLLVLGCSMQKVTYKDPAGKTVEIFNWTFSKTIDGLEFQRDSNGFSGKVNKSESNTEALIKGLEFGIGLAK